MRWILGFAMGWATWGGAAVDDCAAALRDRYGSVGRVLLSDGSECTGTLLSARAVLTAAHCAWRVFPNEVRFTLDRTHRGAQVAEIALHPAFTILADGTDVGPDLAMLRLANTDYGRPPAAFLPGFDSGALGDGDRAEAVGYGVDEAGKSGPRRAKPVVFEEARDLLLKDGKKAANGRLRLRRGDTGELACVGDSGGPVLVERGGRIGIAAVIARGRFTVPEGIRTAPIARLEDPKFLCRNTQLLEATSVAPFFSWIEEKRARFDPGPVVDRCVAAAPTPTPKKKK